LNLRVPGAKVTLGREGREAAVMRCVSSTGIEHVVNRVLYCATGTEFYISPG
jgi:hypothetical protein